MRIKNLSSSFKCNISKQSKKVLRLFVLIKLRKPVFLRAHQIRRSAKKPAAHEGHHSKLVSFFRCSRPNGDMDRVTELKSFSERSHQKSPCPSPITPAYIRMGGTSKREVVVISEKDDNEDACRSFEKYLVEMIVEDGKMRDLVDVEEFLQSWKNIKCPLFVDLVGRFYKELCRDLFSNSSEKEETYIKASKNM